MNKLTTEKCKNLIERLGEDKRASRISIFGELYLQALEIALPVLEQQESPTDTYRQIENDGWIEWKGGERPVAENTRVQVKFSDGYTGIIEMPQHLRWRTLGSVGDIIAYRVIENDGREG